MSAVWTLPGTEPLMLKAERNKDNRLSAFSNGCYPVGTIVSACTWSDITQTITVWCPRFRKAGGYEITENPKGWAFWFYRWKGCFGKKHISNVIRSSSFQLRNISGIRKYLSPDATEQIIHSTLLVLTTIMLFFMDSQPINSIVSRKFKTQQHASSHSPGSLVISLQF